MNKKITISLLTIFFCVVIAVVVKLLSDKPESPRSIEPIQSSKANKVSDDIKKKQADINELKGLSEEPVSEKVLSAGGIHEVVREE